MGTTATVYGVFMPIYIDWTGILLSLLAISAFAVMLYVRSLFATKEFTLLQSAAAIFRLFRPSSPIAQGSVSPVVTHCQGTDAPPAVPTGVQGGYPAPPMTEATMEALVAAVMARLEKNNQPVAPPTISRCNPEEDSEEKRGELALEEGETPLESVTP